ncbi:MAG: glutamate-5-semialdehyde dehydrogenase [Bacillota bacterium]
MNAPIRDMALRAKKAAGELAAAGTGDKNRAIAAMSRLLHEEAGSIMAANRDDLKAAERAGLPDRLLKRLVFDGKKINSRIAALKEIAELPDPVGSADYCLKRPMGLHVSRVRVPIGVIAVIYESRPHVTVNVGALGMKAGNAVILRGGSETVRTNTRLGELWAAALEEAGLPAGAVQVVTTTDRSATFDLVREEGLVDLLVPRGGPGLVRFVRENARVPVLKHYSGICHVYIDRDADVAKAAAVVVDSKVLMPEVCNAAETMLVHRDIAGRTLQVVGDALRLKSVEIRGCPATREILPWAAEAADEDWTREYLDLIINCRVVGSVEEAVDHINTYGSHHTDSIVSENYSAINYFVELVDSSVVLVNASTMFNDGGALGMGAEIGISTDRLHARGPVGMHDLTTYKYVVRGDGHTMGQP